SLVKLSEKMNLPMNKVPLAEVKKIIPQANEKFFKMFCPHSSVKNRSSEGGTSPQSVKKRLRFWEKELHLHRS
nr:hypothetical protein [Victivallales bacterium]